MRRSKTEYMQAENKRDSKKAKSEDDELSRLQSLPLSVGDSQDERSVKSSGRLPPLRQNKPAFFEQYNDKEKLQRLKQRLENEQLSSRESMRRFNSLGSIQKKESLYLSNKIVI